MINTLHTLPEKNPNAFALAFDRLSRRFDPWLLAALTLATRLPFVSRTLFEPDSVNCAIALFRFDLSQDTPHMPGYLLHVMIGRLFFAIVGDPNIAYIAEALALSIGSVLCVWYAVLRCADRRTAMGAALVWMTNPIFWFYGCVATSYPHEAFFSSAVAALALVLVVKKTGRNTAAMIPVALAFLAAISGAARQTSIIFLTPGVLVALSVAQVPRSVWLRATLVWSVTAAAWGVVLLSLAGGLDRYLLLAHELTGQYTSIFFGGTLAQHGDLIGKLVVFLTMGLTAYFTGVVIALLRNRAETVIVIKRGIRSAGGRVLLSLVIVPLVVYIVIMYSKPGYLLNILSVCAIGSAILFHRLRAAGVRVGGAWWVGGWIVAQSLFFVVPFSRDITDELHYQSALASGLQESARYPALGDRLFALRSKLFQFSSAVGIRSADDEHENMIGALDALHTPQDRQVVICTHSTLWAVYSRPHSTVYALTIQAGKPSRIDECRDWTRRLVNDSIVTISSNTKEVVLAMSAMHWAFPEIRSQVHLEQIPSTPYLEMWRIRDEHFRIKVGGVMFEK